jgi:hypothetical protein
LGSIKSIKKKSFNIDIDDYNDQTVNKYKKSDKNLKRIKIKTRLGSNVP